MYMEHVCGVVRDLGAHNNRKHHEGALAHKSFDRCARQAGPSQPETGQRLKAWGLPSTGERKREFPGRVGSRKERVLVYRSDITQQQSRESLGHRAPKDSNSLETS